MYRAILLLVAIACPTVTEAGPCAIRALPPQPIVNSAIAPGGGVIVGLLHPGVGTTSHASAIDKRWRFQDVNQLVEPTIVDIAPGLAVYTLPPTGGPQLALLDGDGAEVAKVVRGQASPALKAPVLTAFTYETRTAVARRGAGTSITGTADIAEIPADAAVLVVYEVTKQGTVARSWHPLAGVSRDAKPAKVTAYQSGGRCNPTIAGIAPVAQGAKVVVAWLDTSGRLSPMSRPVTARRVQRS